MSKGLLPRRSRPRDTEFSCFGSTKTRWLRTRQVRHTRLRCDSLPNFCVLTFRPRETPDKVNVNIGPQLSTTLKAMANEVKSSKDDWSGGICPHAPPQFYVSDATESDATLIPDYVRHVGLIDRHVENSRDVENSSCLASNTCLRDFFHAKGIALYRLIATDVDKILRGAKPATLSWTNSAAKSE